MSKNNVLAALERVAEKRINESIQRGEFDNLPGSGKPLNLEDDRQIPDDLRLAYKVLRNADCLPPELELKKEIRTAEELLRSLKDESAKYRQIKKINYLIMKLNTMRNGSVQWEEKQLYYEKMVDQVGARRRSKKQR
ncbi:MAG: DUF1992 domain-containing protein [Deltaproteobacteria bacterium]|jgi:hypothetical protein|nr:MAG: DUF1992 domain-containing protein [Deltaproteobacteria bacterium]